MQLIAALGLVPLFAYFNAATGSTLPSPGGGRWWSHWMTALAQGALIGLMTHSVVLTLAFSVGWYVWRKIEFGFLLDRTAPQTMIGRWIDDSIVDSENGRWLVRWFAPAILLGLIVMVGGHHLVGLIISAAGFATAHLYINRARMTPWLREALAGATWGIPALVAVLL